MSNEKRARQRANREQQRAEQAKQARRAARMKTIRSGVIVGVVVIIVGIGFFLLTDSGDDEAAPASTTTTTTGEATTAAPVGQEVNTAEYATYRSQPTACGAEAPPPATLMSFDAPADQNIDPTSPPRAVIETSCGPVTVELDPVAAPETVNSFVFLAREGYFDGSASHRIIPGFVVQAGDPTARGDGGPGYSLPDELPPAGFVYDRGVVAMANAGPNTSGSQFFLVLGETALGPNFTVFGEVVDGFEALDAMAEVPLAARGNEVSIPRESVYIESIEIIP